MHIFSFILKVAQSQSRALVIAGLLLAASGLLQIGATISLARVVRQALQQTDGLENWYSIAQTDGLRFLIFATASILLLRIANQMFSSISGRLRTNAAMVFCRQLYDHSRQFYIDNSSGKLAYLTESASMRLQVIIQIFVFEIWPAIVTVLVAGYIMVKAHVGLALAIFLWAVVYFFITLYLSSQRRGLDTEAEQTNTIAVADMADTLNKRELVKLFVQYEKEAGRVRNITSLVNKYRLKFTLQSEKARIFQFGMVTLIRVLIVGLVAGLVLIGELGTSEFILAVFLTSLIIVYVQKSAERVHILLLFWATLVNALDEIMQPHAVGYPAASDPVDQERPDIAIQNVTFAYGTGQTVLQGLNVDIPFGQNVAIVGGSGSGKTTLASLLLRDYDADMGGITIGGTPLNRLTRKTLANLCAVVPQTNELWGASIKDNIAFGRIDASLEEIERAAKQAGCHEFIMATPNGYDTILGGDGEGLSGGQTQRLAIARAVLMDCPIMVLDEPSSGLDSITEAKLMASLMPYAEAKTLVVVTHHISIAEKMDRVLFMEGGRIIANGPHHELMKTNTAYSQLWATEKLKRAKDSDLQEASA